MEQDARGQARAGIEPGSSYMEQLRHARTMEGLAGGEPLRLALLASSSMEQFAPILRAWLADAGYAAEIHLAAYDTIETEILDPSSALYAFDPQVVVILPTAESVLSGIPASASAAAVQDSAKAEAARWQGLWAALSARCPAQIVQATVPPPAVRPLGNRDGVTPAGAIYRIRLFNLLLGDGLPANVALFDLAWQAEAIGHDRWADARFWHHSKHAFAFDNYGIVAHALARTIAGARGKARKCLVLDLDNTLWGGVIGDDGLDGIALGPDSGADGEAFVAFQTYLKTLKDDGILLAVCSKNDIENARMPFVDHPHMVLREDDVSCFVANWNNKADNIRAIAKDLNIGLDSLVFVDDNPAERQLIRAELPEVAVIELPDDPALYTEALDGGLLFERPRVTDEDRARTAMMLAEANRQRVAGNVTDLTGYLRDLALVAEAGNVDGFTLPRVTQLINKTNQFNLTGERLGEGDVAAYGDAPRVCRWYRLRDRFGEYGLVSAVLARHQDDALLIDNWVLSCRAFQRTLEAFILADLAQIAREFGCGRIRAAVCDTGRNAVARDALVKLGFAPSGSESSHPYEYVISSAAPHTLVAPHP